METAEEAEAAITALIGIITVEKVNRSSVANLLQV